MLLLKDIVKDYPVKDNKPVQALKDVTLAFRDTGFVSILGASGCGKTTLLNIIGGLDKYTSGDVIINGQSTKDYTDRDWDAYRNREVGIVFQSYNLIPHLTILGNVELAMTLSGVSSHERTRRAKEALEAVGLSEQMNKKPNQLSGGQMQRVALARALVNKPNIILADEPTGALDSKTSLQVMDILKEISKTKLVITVTHNEELAEKYSDRIIRLSDGRILSDTGIDVAKEIAEVEKESARLYAEKEADKAKEEKGIKAFFRKHFKRDLEHTSMGMNTALGISGRNLLTKKAKTIITAIAASIGIIGVGLVLALSNGFSGYVSRMEQETLSKFPMSVEKYGYSAVTSGGSELPSYPDEDVIHVVEPDTSMFHTNRIDADYIRYLESLNTEEETYATYRYSYSIGMHVISHYTDERNEDVYTSISTGQSSFVESMASSIMGTSTPWQELPADEDLILEQYDILAGSYPDEETLQLDENGIPDQNEFGLVLVVNSRNRLSTTLLQQLGLQPKAGTLTFQDILDDIQFKYIPSDDYYIPATDADGNTIQVSTPGIFFKEEVTMDEILSAMTTLAQEDVDIEEMLSYLDLLDLPDFGSDQTILNQILEDPDVANVLSNIALGGYIDFENLRSFISGLLSGEATLNWETIRGLVNEDVINDHERAKEFGLLLYDLVIAILQSDIFSRNLTYYRTPTSEELGSLFASEKARTLKISCILRPKETTSIGLLNEGIYYPSTLTYQTFADNADSAIAKEFKNHIYLTPTSDSDNAEAFADTIAEILPKSEEPDYTTLLPSILSSYTFTMCNVVDSLDTIYSMDDYMNARLELGTDVSFQSGVDFLDPMTYADFVSSITIYPSDYEAKQYLVSKLNEYNADKAEEDKIVYTDVGQIATDMVGQIVQVISAVLIAFASISLVVSSVMIAIIIYSSVVERTKEIGILRSIGARKKDVSRLFKAEAVIIGFLSGLFGILMTYLISLPINLVLNNMFPDVQLGSIAFLNPLHALLLLLVSVALTYLASLVPSRIAAKKDPVTCLRTE